MTMPDICACIRALHARSGGDKAADAPSERAWFDALLDEENKR